MELKNLCICRMRKLLFDLLSNMESALRNLHNSSDSRGTVRGNFCASAKGFLEHLYMFNDLVDTRMKTGPMETLYDKNDVQHYIANLKSARDEVEALESELAEERSRHRHIVRAISNEIAEENLRRRKIRARHATEIAEIIKISEDEIARIEEEAYLKTKRLEMEIDASKSRLADGSRANLSRERELYAKRSEAERRYLGILGKYDVEIGELHRTMESLAEELSSFDERLVDLRDQLVVQDVRYVQLKNEREMAILKSFAQDLDNFKKNRAARIIQKAWRCFYERCCMRKKKKSKKKK